jgi:CBS domain-containing protein
MVGVDYPAHLALSDANRRGVHGVLVLADDSTPVGVASRAALEAVGTSPVRCAEVTDCPVISDQATLEDAMTRMQQMNVSCLSVVAWHGGLRGVITAGDIARAQAESAELKGNPLSAGAEPGRCASCGDSDELQWRDESVAFCISCLAHTRAPQRSWEELYFTLGGQG